MQSELNELSPKASLNQHTQDSRPNSQHGFDHPDQQPHRQFRAGEGRAKTGRCVSSASSSTSSSGGSDDSLERSLRGLRKSSPIHRISEHEKASTRLAKKRSNGPTFTVVQRGRTSGVDRVALTDFPNGPLFIPFRPYSY